MYLLILVVRICKEPKSWKKNISLSWKLSNVLLSLCLLNKQRMQDMSPNCYNGRLLVEDLWKAHTRYKQACLCFCCRFFLLKTTFNSTACHPYSCDICWEAFLCLLKIARGRKRDSRSHNPAFVRAFWKEAGKQMSPHWTFCSICSVNKSKLFARSIYGKVKVVDTREVMK